ncbi:fumarylacetoacetate hydrolase family protein [Lacihabitans soyangensis]|uniref:2-hydroxyhepta-2,4-diene-1,7-dioate isomerase n=1 Tax=Lacihabitans soyangensis TaxID=869394 RepID=A0AAE3H1N7_9BACT|nr:fumarylacetoacetate hydrolase family protein [Lacihabitans soyangensis]MCP9763158.1 2-hydroxyhepta-2,4-diene-1,7-dioate isomerase [Lacihabitans soyangensis]
MKIYNTTQGIIAEKDSKFFKINDLGWDQLINQPALFAFLNNKINNSESVASLDESTILAPIVSQEIWASGVTYLRSKTARMEESKDAGGGDFYDRVYDAERPEIFFKATAARTVGHLQDIRIRKDSKWNVPEPELTLFVNNQNQIAGYTIGNDVSSRDIEGENPLYLPQAKSYDKSAAIGPCILVLEEPISRDTDIAVEILREGKTVFDGKTQLSQMKRELPELVEYLTRECSFPQGVFLMTGTGTVPPDDFTMISGDEVKISIDNIGTLINTVE